MFFSKSTTSQPKSIIETMMSALLDGTSSRMMAVDNDLNITYANQSVIAYLKGLEKTIQHDLPNFSVDKLVGSNIDIFHKNPAHQRGMLKHLKAEHLTTIKISGQYFNLRAFPLQSPTGEHIGSAVEWLDPSQMDNLGQVAAIQKSQAVIEFNLDGTIVSANENFLSVMGYAMSEIKGKHHSIFVSNQESSQASYKTFWDDLRSGKFYSGEYKRLGKNGKEVWIEATYNPILDLKGKPYKVVKYASDITTKKLEAAEFKGQIDAINKAQGVIEFTLDGRIIKANQNFLNVMGYSESEITGKHHSIFVDSEYAKSDEYKAFWATLSQGQFQSSVYQRVGKGGREVWIQASYNPIFDASGKPYKVVKYASNITDMIHLTDRTKGNIESVAAATEEMSSSISEIGQSMTKTEGATREILEQTTSAENSSKNLISATSSMESITALIRDIAGQVNLLALNATIEAARAGEAGKGFAVVASEVKNLANATAAATNDIEREIQTVQQISKQVANDVNSITSIGSKVGEYVSVVASALTEQSAVINEISKSAQLTLDDVAVMIAKIKNEE